MCVFVTGAFGFSAALCGRYARTGHRVTAPRSSDCNLLRTIVLTHGGANVRPYLHLAVTQAGILPAASGRTVIAINLEYPSPRLVASEQPQAKLISIGTSCAYAQRDRCERNATGRGAD